MGTIRSITFADGSTALQAKVLGGFMMIVR